jgi:hypothetical protein
MNRADLHAYDLKIADCNVRLEAARADEDRVHLVRDLEAELDTLVGNRTLLATKLGLLAA